jgi:hypothetical protein
MCCTISEARKGHLELVGCSPGGRVWPGRSWMKREEGAHNLNTIGRNTLKCWFIKTKKDELALHMTVNKKNLNHDNYCSVNSSLLCG